MWYNSSCRVVFISHLWHGFDYDIIPRTDSAEKAVKGKRRKRHRVSEPKQKDLNEKNSTAVHNDMVVDAYRAALMVWIIFGVSVFCDKNIL